MEILETPNNIPQLIPGKWYEIQMQNGTYRVEIIKEKRTNIYEVFKFFDDTWTKGKKTRLNVANPANHVIRIEPLY